MEHHIAIIGAGPRGTYCFRRLALELAGARLNNPVHIHVVEKSGKFGGGGIHSVTQPHYLLLNTVASQITAFGDDDHEAVELNVLHRGSGLSFRWSFSREIHAATEVAALARATIAELRAIADLLDSDSTFLTPSDFPLAGLDQGELDDLFGDD